MAQPTSGDTALTVTETRLYHSHLLAAYPVVCVFTGKPTSFGGQSASIEQHWTNRRALCRQLGLPDQALRMPDQVHGAGIGFLDQPTWSNTDAVIVDRPGVPVACQYADCVPVVLYAPRQHVGAVIHAGWRGTAQQITRLTAETLCQQHNLLPDNLLAVIGPAIGGCCFEVGAEVVNALVQTVPDVNNADLLTGVGPNGNPLADVKAVNRLQLTTFGVKHIEVLPDCTRCEPDHLWSHRRGEAGRQLALLCLN